MNSNELELEPHGRKRWCDGCKSKSEDRKGISYKLRDKCDEMREACEELKFQCDEVREECEAL